MYVDLPAPVSVTAGDPIYVCIKLQSSTGYYPVCLSGSYSGGAYYSTSSITGPYSGMSYDWSVRAVIYNPYADMPATGPVGLGILLMAMGGFLLRRRRR
jgi:LPXTG-motif cell wall-anchored protein